MYCKYCSKLIDEDSMHCKFCGKDVSSQKNNEDAIDSSKIIGISEKRAHEWWDYFCKFSWFSEMWSDAGFAQNSFWQHAHQITIENIPHVWESKEDTPFALPICNKKWCIEKINLNDNEINYGLLWAAQTKLVIFDFELKNATVIDYKSIKDINQSCPDIYISTAYNLNINIKININYPSKKIRNTWFVINLIAGLGSKSIADSEALDSRNTRDEEEYRNIVEWANSYFLGIHKFFYEITSFDELKLKNILTVNALKTDSVDYSLLIEGIKLYEKNEFISAIEKLSIFIASYQKNQLGYFYLGKSFFALNNFVESQKNFIRAINMDVNYGKAWLELGRTYGELGRVSESKDAFKNAKLIEDGIKLKKIN